MKIPIRHLIALCLIHIGLFHFVNGQAWNYTIPGDSISLWLREEIAEHLSRATMDSFSVPLVRVPDKIVLPEGNCLRLIELKEELPRGNVVATISFFREGEQVPLKTFTVSAYVETFQQVAVTTRDIRKGDTLSPEDFRMVVKETTKLRGNYCTQPDQVTGKIAATFIRENSVIDSRFLKEVPIIRKGERITLMYHQPPVTIRVVAIALQEGSLGDWIWVKNLQSNKTLKAKVSGKGLVTIQK